MAAHILACALALGGCGRSDVPPAASAPSVGAASAPASAPTGAPDDGATGSVMEPQPRDEGFAQRVRSNGGLYEVSYALQAAPQGYRDLFDIRLRVHRLADPADPLRDLRVVVDADMPDHRHGMNTTPRVTRAPDGTFTVSGLQFHMTGYWELYVDLEMDGVTERAQFEVIVE